MDIDTLLRGFADETRLRALHLLAREKELCVCDIQAVLGLPQPRISRHLAYLRKSGLVTSRRDGLWKRYSLAPSRSRFHRGLIGCLRGCFGEDKTLKRDARALAKRRRAEGRCR